MLEIFLIYKWKGIDFTWHKEKKKQNKPRQKENYCRGH